LIKIISKEISKFIWIIEISFVSLFYIIIHFNTTQIMENLFLQVMTISEREEIDMIKANKTFTKRLVEDLSKVYKFYAETSDFSDYSVVRIGSSANHKYDKPSFHADKNGIRFYAKVLGYRNSQNYGTELNDVYLRNPNSKADKSFLDSKLGHGYIEMRIDIPLANYDTQLRDVMFVLNLLRFSKNF
jgi:hypothetical protein